MRIEIDSLTEFFSADETNELSIHWFSMKYQIIAHPYFRIIHAENVTLRRRKSHQIHDFSHLNTKNTVFKCFNST